MAANRDVVLEARLRCDAGLTTGAFKSVAKHNVPRYFAEFQYRFNRRFKWSDLLPHLVRRSCGPDRMPAQKCTLLDQPKQQTTKP
jgi:hypothetical protein